MRASSRVSPPRRDDRSAGENDTVLFIAIAIWSSLGCSAALSGSACRSSSSVTSESWQEPSPEAAISMPEDSLPV